GCWRNGVNATSRDIKGDRVEASVIVGISNCLAQRAGAGVTCIGDVEGAGKKGSTKGGKQHNGRGRNFHTLLWARLGPTSRQEMSPPREKYRAMLATIRFRAPNRILLKAEPK